MGSEKSVYRRENVMSLARDGGSIPQRINANASPDKYDPQTDNVDPQIIEGLEEPEFTPYYQDFFKECIGVGVLVESVAGYRVQVPCSIFTGYNSKSYGMESNSISTVS